MTTPALAIQTESLTKTYGSVRAVTGLTVEVRRGEVFGFLGPNGAGKTTTIRMLLALQRPSAGRAMVLGMDALRDSVQIHRRVGYLPGELSLPPRRTGRQLLDWFAGARRGVDAALIGQLVDRFEVVLDRPVRELSKGNRQKLGLVIAFMHRPELLILDEPVSGLDPLMQNEFEGLIRETAAAGGTVFLSSHELDEVQRLADRVGIIRAGELMVADTVENLRRRAPQRIEARFDRPVDRSAFAALPGVIVSACDDARVVLEVTGRVGPVLRLIADLDPGDVVAQHAGLDELFLAFYRTPETADDPTHAG